MPARASCASFLGRFVPIAGAPATERATYRLQGGPTGDLPPMRVLLGIAGPPIADDEAAAPAGDTGSRIDAAITIPNELLVAIEVKTVGELDPAQLKRHEERWGTTSRAATQWMDVHRWAEAEIAIRDDPVSSFLLRQFVEYLGWANLAGFAGFEPSDFDPTNDDGRSNSKSKLRALWASVLDGLSEAESDQLGEIHANRIASGEWPRAQSNHDAVGANITIALRPEWVEPHLAAWLAEPGAAFRRWLATPTAAATLRGLADYELVIFARRAHGYENRDVPDKKPYWQQNTIHELWSAPTLEIDDQTADGVVRLMDSLDSKWEKPAMNLRRRIPSTDAINAGNSFAETLAYDVRRLLPLQSAINSLL
jgi:hypothetical protein